ncbi:MAG: TolC family protein [Firmicutes bacterium]|nr:TolC family protein [Bacillota bacterium]
MNLTSLCIRRPVTTTMIFLILVLLGLFNSTRMPIDLYPDIASPAVNISTTYSGAGPEEVEQLVTIPIEQAVATVNRVTAVTSSSQEGRSWVTVYFDWGINLEQSIDEIRTNLDRVARRLPDQAGTPTINRYDPSTAPIMTIGLSGQMDESFLRTIAENEISPELQKIDGLANVEVRGGRNRRIAIELKRERLAAFGITINQVASAIRSENIILPAGSLETETSQLLLRTSGKLESVADLKKIIVAYRNNIPLFLRDLGTVEETLTGTETLVRIDRQPGIVLSLQKQSGANTVAVANEVYTILSRLQNKYPELNLRVLNDTSTFIRESVGGVANAALWGALLAGLVLLFFLQDWRATLIAGVVMPVSILATLVIAYFFKMTLNTISLGGLALGVGMLVDNTVVVIDNIFRKLENPDLNPAEAALEGTNEMRLALLASTLTTVCVFFPVIYLSGRTGIVFKELAYMVIFSLLCSYVVAVTLVPMLSAKYLQPNGHRHLEQKESYLLTIQKQWEHSYRNLLAWCLEHKTLVVLGCLLLLVSTLLLWPLIGTELVPVTDEGLITISCTLPPGTKLVETDLQAQKFEELIAQIPEVENMEVSVRNTRANFTLRLHPRSKRQRSTNEVLAELQNKLVLPYAGASLRINARNSMRMLYSSSDSAIVIDLRGYNQELGRQTAEVIVSRLSALPGISNVGISRDAEEPEFRIEINRQRAADLGVSTARIAEAIQSAFVGLTATTIRRNGEELPVHVSLQDSDKASIQDVGRLLVPGRNNQLFPLASMVETKLSNSPVTVQRKDRERNLAVTARLEEGADLAAMMRLIQTELNDLQLPPGFNLYYGGDFEEQQRSFSELRLTLIMAVLLVYMVMASQFESLLDPFLIMFSLPFTLGGVLLMLLLTDTLINTQVYIGLIILAGIAVNNGIVLISYFRLLLNRGLTLQEAVLSGSAARLRPVLMTSITTIFGLIPLALGMGAGSELQAPLARAVIGGLTFSMLLTLVLIPVLFTAVAERADKSRPSRRLGRSTRSGSPLLLFLLLGLVLSCPRPAWAGTEETNLTLGQSIKLALEQSEDGQIILYQRERAASSLREASGEKALQAYSELKVGTGQTPFTIGLNLEKNLPLTKLWGVSSYTEAITAQNYQLNLLSLDLQEEQLISRIISAYQQVLLSSRRCELAKQSLQQVRAFSEEVKLKSELGFTNIVEETRAQAQLAAAENGMVRAEQQYRLAQFNLQRLLNLTTLDEPVLAPLPAVNFEGDLKTLLQSAIAHRSDLKQAKIRTNQAETLLALAKLANNLGISLNWNFTAPNFSADLNLSNQNQSRTTGEWGVTGKTGLLVNPSSFISDGHTKLELVLRWNWSDGNRRQERITQAELLQEQQEAELRKLEKIIEYEVTEAYYRYRDQQNTVATSELQLAYNRTNWEAQVAKYRLGLASIKEVLDAQVLLSQAETNYEQSKADLFLAYIDLLKVTGRLGETTFP